MQQPSPDRSDPVPRPVVVVGGANMDLKARTDHRAVPATSNPGTHHWTPGGVGRNIAENLARLGGPVELVAAVGEDPLGRDLIDRTAAAGVGVTHVITGEDPTGVYVAVLDEDGELVIGVSDMAATDRLTVDVMAPTRELIDSARLLVLDGNLPERLVGWLLDVATAAHVPVVLDPVSVPKATHLRTTLTPDRPLLAVTPNVDELAAIVGRPLGDEESIRGAAQWLHDRGVEIVWVRRGASGSLLSQGVGGAEVVLALPAPVVDVVDVTGSGDAMTAGFIHHLVEHGVGAQAARFGQMTAALTAEVPQTVRPDLTPALVQSRLDAQARTTEEAEVR